MPLYVAESDSAASHLLNTYNKLIDYKKKIEENKKNSKKSEEKEMIITMKIQGMMCPHCEARVRDVLNAVCFVEYAEVSHERDEAVCHIASGVEPDRAELISVVENAGYKVISVE